MPRFTFISLMLREIKHFFREKARLFGALIAPIGFWVTLGFGLSSTFSSKGLHPGESVRFFFPGSLCMMLLFGSIFANISLIEDKNEGFLQGVLVTPISRLSIVVGKVSGGAFITTLQGFCFFLLAPMAGYHMTVMMLMLMMVCLILGSIVLGAFGFLFAWQTDSIAGFHSVMNVILFPMWLLSGSFFSLDALPSWLNVVFWINPMRFIYGAIQNILINAPRMIDFFSLGFMSCLLIGINVIMVRYGSSYKKIY